MILELFLVLLIGIIIGIFTGLIPGIHVNLVAAAILSLSVPLLKYFEPISLGVFIISLTTTHSFLDTIPSIYVGAPENENALSVLPGQKMLLQGKGHMAVKITLLGTYFGLILSILLIPIFLFVAEMILELVKPYFIHIISIIILFMIIREKQKFWSIFLFILSGTLGVVVFSLPKLNEPLFPLLSGIFGISGLLISYFENTSIPKQDIINKIDLKITTLVKALFGSTIAVFIIQFLPGFGPAQGAVISNSIVKLKDKGYLALIGAMGTMSVVFSLVTFYALGKAKDGTIVAISKLIQINQSYFLIFVCTLFISGSISVVICLYTSKIFSVLISKVNYKLLVISIIAFIFLMSLLLNGPIGIIVLLTSSAVGLIAPLKNIPRSHAMGCLILPVLLFLIL